MNWKLSRKELPPLTKATRCIALIREGAEASWEGYVDVYFSPFEGWRRCETGKQVYVMKWIPIDEIDKEIGNELD